MKSFKHKETGQVINEANPNHYSIYERFGYEEVQVEAKKTKAKKKIEK